MKVNDIISRAKAELNTKESPPNSNNVKYNTWYYGKNVSGASYPWCCAFISWLFRDNQALCKKTASCQDLLAWFESKKQTVKTPQAGDIVFFKYATNNRRTNHVGIVISVNGKQITTIEGNTSLSSNDNGGSVLKRIRSTNIVAYARPKYDDVEKITEYPLLKYGSRNDYVKILKTYLNKNGYSLDVNNDYFGHNTERDVISYQGLKGLKKDGKVGENTWNTLLKG